MKAIAIIPARSGSKGLKDKNIVEVHGKPLIAYTIEAALESGCFDKVMVSTDSEKYAEISKQYGAKVPFLRNAATAGDTAGTWDVVREVLKKYQDAGQGFDYVAVLQPTSPLRNAEDIRNAFAMQQDKQVKNVVSVTEVAHPVQWCFPLEESRSLAEFAKSPDNMKRRQELGKHYQENGAIYLVDAGKIMDPAYNLYMDQCYAYIMPRERSVDIDERVDLIILKAMLENQ